MYVFFKKLFLGVNNSNTEGDFTMKTVRTNFKLRRLPLLGKMVMFLLIGFLGFGGNLLAETCSFLWISAPVEENVLGYRLYYGTTSRYDLDFVYYDRVIDIGNVTSYTVSDLDEELASIWYFAITAYNQYDESDYSDELSCDISLQPGNELPEAKIFTDITTAEAPLFVSFDGSESTDTDGAVIEYFWDFGDGENENGAFVDHTYLEIGNYIVTLTVTDNEGATDQAQVIISVKEAESEPVNMMINFQPASVSVPDGYSMDSGQSYEETKGYGWTQAPASLGTRDRNNSLSPDQAHDTIIHVAPTAVWEAAIQNGTYTVTVCTGDPSYPSDSQSIQIEGLTFIEDEFLNSSQRWIERSTAVTVSDGRLTVTFEGSDLRARLCFITVSSY